MSAIGVLMNGRSGVESELTKADEAWAKASVWTSSDLTVRKPTAGVAVFRLNVTVAGMGQDSRTLHGRFLMVIAKLAEG